MCGEVRCFKSPHYTIEISFAWERHTYYVAFFFFFFCLSFFFLSTFLSVSLRDLRQQCTTLTETNKSSLFPFDCFFFLYISCCFEREKKKKSAFFIIVIITLVRDDNSAGFSVAITLTSVCSGSFTIVLSSLSFSFSFSL